MSFSEILEEIPKLSLTERREIFLQVLSFKLGFGFSQLVAIFQSIPSQPMRICALVESQVPAQRPRHTLIQQNLHAASKAASERSSTFTAKSFETEGKHSKNSSNV